MTQPVYAIAAGGVTSLGDDLETSWDALLRGRSGVRGITRFPTDHLPTKIAATVERPDHTTSARLCGAMALSAVRECLSQVVTDPDVRRNAGVYVASPVLENEWEQMLRRGGDPRSRYHSNEMISEMSDTLAEAFGSQSVPMIMNTACASGGTVIATATEAIRRGEHEMALVVGVDSSVFAESIARFSLLSAMSTRNADPAGACRPFSVGRDGFVMGEGAGALVLVSAELAERLGRDPVGRVSGIGNATDNFHRTRSNPSGASIVASMTSALADAGLAPAQIKHVNAHGTGTPENDKMESLGVREVFGDDNELTLTANKSAIGHTLMAAGILEAIFAMKSLQHRVIPPTLNYEPELSLGVRIADRAQAADFDHVLSNSFGFGGQNVSLVISRA